MTDTAELRRLVTPEEWTEIRSRDLGALLDRIEDLERMRLLLDEAQHGWHAANARIEELEAVIRRMETQCRLGIRRAAFAPEIGQKMTENWRADIANECARLEALARLDGEDE